MRSSANRRNVSPTSLEVGVEVARSRLAGEIGEERRVAVCAQERAGRVERAGLDVPLSLAAEHPRRHVVDGVGDERAGDATSTSPFAP